jgi:hypothetical protein
LERARGQFTIIQDADLEYDPQDFARLLAPLVEGCATVVYGSRRFSISGTTFSLPPTLTAYHPGWGANESALYCEWYSIYPEHRIPENMEKHR